MRGYAITSVYISVVVTLLLILELHRGL